MPMRALEPEEAAMLPSTLVSSWTYHSEEFAESLYDLAGKMVIDAQAKLIQVSAQEFVFVFVGKQTNS